MVSTNLEKIFYHHLLENKDHIDLVKPRFFETDSIKECFKLASEFYEKYSKSPTRQQIEELVKLKGIEETVTNAKLDIIYGVDLSTYDSEWLQENVHAWIEYKNLDNSVFDLLNYLQTTNVTTENVKDVVQQAKSIISERNNLDFNFDQGLDFFDPDSHDQIETNTFSSGYDFIDRVSGGGFSVKTLWVFLGMAKVGKSIWLANLATSSVRMGYNTAYISLEMNDRKVVKRLGANLLNVKMSEYKQFAKDKMLLKKKLKNLGYDSLTLRVPGKLVVKEYPTSTASTQDLERWLLKMQDQQGFKFKVIFVDYINIMKNWRNPNTENTYMKIKQIAEDLRAVAMRNEWAIITATQVGRSSYDSTDLSMSSVSESAALIHTIDMGYGIIQDPIMHSNREYILKVLANRDEGHKNVKKKFKINYDYMNITEDMDSEPWSDD